MPGVLQLEAMAQVGGIIALQEPVTDGKGDFFFAGVSNVKWRRPVVPGDNLVMQMEYKCRARPDPRDHARSHQRPDPEMDHARSHQRPCETKHQRPGSHLLMPLSHSA
jgi:hypothetical protein